MEDFYKYLFRAILSLFLISIWSSAHAQENGSTEEELIYPDTTWMQYASPEEAGWSSEGIEQARNFADSIGSKAVMLVYNGAIVAKWGYTKDIAPIASIRKSLFSALMGIAVEKGTIDTSSTLAELGIDDKPPLTEKEKQARVIHLLTTSSGVYHKAAGESPGIQKPKRGSTDPGEQWYYNNWDFNALATIYEQETNTRIFEAFEEQIAEPIGMEDYNTGYTRYILQPDRSKHPAYSMWMSARDLARFGLLYLRKGRWNGQQIIPAEWIEDSRRIHKEVPGDAVAGYGLSWWIPAGKMQEYEIYLASGSGNQSIMILPKLNIVFVHRASAILDEGVHGLAVHDILSKLLDTRNEQEVDEPQLIPVNKE